MAKVKIDGYLCERCLHAWLPRDEDYPKVCPKCKSPYWDKPRKDTTTNETIQAWYSMMQKRKRSVR